MSDGQGPGGVAALAVSSGVLLVGGRFNQASNSSTDHVPAANLARWNGTSWSALGNAAAGGAGVNDWVFAIAVKGNDVYVGGFFSKVGALSVNHIAKWNSLSNTWSALGPGSGARDNGVGVEGCDGGFCSSGTVRAIAVSGNDVYAGGNFDTVYNGPGSLVSAPNIAKWNTLTNTWSAVGGGTNGQLFALTVDGDNLYVGGAFQYATNSDNSVVYAGNIARWNLTTNTWSALGDGSDSNNNGTGGYVVGIAVRGNEVYVAGGFTTVCSSASNCISANYVARWNKLTSAWSALGSGSGPAGNGLRLWNNNAGGVADVVVLGNDVYVCGGFDAVYNSNSSSILTSGIARWNGSSWFALGSGTSATGQGVSGIGVGQPLKMTAVGTDLYVVGHGFPEANNSETDHVVANGIAKWNGSAWSALGSGLIPGGGAAIAATSTHLYVGGSMSYTGGNITANFGRYQLAQASNCPTIIVRPAQIIAGVAGLPYIWGFVQTGGVRPVTFSLSAGSLPSGLSLSAAGALYGIPAQTGRFPITIKATDANGCMGTREYTLAINCPPIIITPAAVPRASVGRPYRHTFNAHGGGENITFSFTGTLPPGLSLNSSTGVLSGVPTQAGNFNFTVKATGIGGCMGSRGYTLTVR